MTAPPFARSLRAVAATLLLGLCPPALAAPEVLPYDGVLYLDGQPVNQPVNMRFSLYGQAEGGDALWTETWDPTTAAVDVKSGRFHAKLGSFESITARILDAGTLWVGVEVMNAANAWRPLGGRQRLKRVPFAGKTLGGGEPCGDLPCNEDDPDARFVVEGALTAGSLAARSILTEDATISGASTVRALDVAPGGATEIRALELTGDAVLTADEITVGELRANDYAVAGDLALTEDAERQITQVSRVTLSGVTRLARMARDGVDYATLVGDALVFNRGEGSAGVRVYASRLETGTANAQMAGDSSEPIVVEGSAGFGVLNAATLAVPEGATDVQSLSTRVLSVNQCRLCFQITGTGGNVHACVRMVPGESSGEVAPRATLNSNSRMSVGVLCDGGESTAGRGIVL